MKGVPSVQPILLLAFTACLIGLSGCSLDKGNQERYLKYCASCHGPGGEGLRSLYPPLKGSAYLSHQIDQLPCLIAEGVRSPFQSHSRTPKMRMPSFDHFTGEEMTGLIAYLHAAWGDGGQTPSKQDVELWLDSCR